MSTGIKRTLPIYEKPPVLLVVFCINCTKFRKITEKWRLKKLAIKIDIENKTLTINKNLNKDNQIDTTKNIYSNRVIPIFKKSLEILKKYKNVEGRIFNYTQRKCEKEFQKIIEILGTKYTIHSLRHTFITKCQEANIPLHIVQRWVGHNIGSKVTNTVYTHTRELAELENIEKMNNYN